MFQINSKGYTLVELLLYLAIVSILLTAVSGFFIVVADSRMKAQTISQVDQQGTFALEYITRSARNATDINSPGIGFSSSGMNLASDESSKNPTVLSINNGVLQIAEGAAGPVSLTDSTVQVTNLTVKNLSKSNTHGTIQISFIIRRTSVDKRNSHEYQKTFISTATLKQ